MKSVLTALSTMVIGTTGIIPMVENIKTSDIARSSVVDINIELPIKGNFLEASATYNMDSWPSAGEGVWDYVTVNLGSGINPSKITGINVPYNDSYSEHKVEARDFYNKRYDGGIHHWGQFQGVVFRQGQANPNWNVWNVVNNSQQNFGSSTRDGGFDHDVFTGIKYWWHFNSNGELLVDIVSYILLQIFATTDESVASVNLGSWITFHYQP